MEQKTYRRELWDWLVDGVGEGYLLVLAVIGTVAFVVWGIFH